MQTHVCVGVCVGQILWNHIYLSIFMYKCAFCYCFSAISFAVKSVITFLVTSTFHTHPHIRICTLHMHIPVCVHSKRRYILGINVEIIGVRCTCVFYVLHQNILQNTSFAGKIRDMYGDFNRISYA